MNRAGKEQLGLTGPCAFSQRFTPASVSLPARASLSSLHRLSFVQASDISDSVDHTGKNPDFPLNPTGAPGACRTLGISLCLHTSHLVSTQWVSLLPRQPSRQLCFTRKALPLLVLVRCPLVAVSVLPQRRTAPVVQAAQA